MKYKIYTDGGSRGNPGLAACAFVLKDENNTIVNSSGFFLGVMTNNQAEYQGLFKALEYLLQKEILEVDVYMDSELVIKQIKGEYKVKDKNIKLIKGSIDKLILRFKHITFNHVLRELNKEADALVNKTLDEHI